MNINFVVKKEFYKDIDALFVDFLDKIIADGEAYVVGGFDMIWHFAMILPQYIDVKPSFMTVDIYEHGEYYLGVYKDDDHPNAYLLQFEWADDDDYDMYDAYDTSFIDKGSLFVNDFILGKYLNSLVATEVEPKEIIAYSVKNEIIPEYECERCAERSVCKKVKTVDNVEIFSAGDYDCYKFPKSFNTCLMKMV